MVGEIVTGVVGGVAQAAGEAMSAPVAVAASVGEVASSLPTVASAVTEIAPGVTEGLGAVRSAVIPTGETLGMPLESFSAASELSLIAKSGDSHMALSVLAFGDIGKNALPEAARSLPDAMIKQDFIDLEQLGPQVVQGLSQEVDSLDLPKGIIDNPEFLENFAKEFGQDVSMQKKRMENGELSAEEYMSNRQGLLQQSAERAEKQTKATQINEKDLEEIKRQAALDAIRQHMQIWRQSVMADKRLTPEAKQKALRRIDLFERKVLIQQTIKWDGMSVMKLIALATVLAQEMTS